MIYCVVCTDTNKRVNWQFELLEYSWKRAGQPGELIRLVTSKSNSLLPRHRYAKTYHIEAQPCFYLGYKAFERLFALKEWIKQQCPFGTILVVDPDIVFLEPIVNEAIVGRPRAQHWLDFIPSSKQIQPITWPMLIHTADLEVLLPYWISHTAAIYRATRRWESDMHALVSASSVVDLHFSLETIAAFVGWPEECVADAPIIHYCQDILDKHGNILWSKRSYSPWAGVPQAEQAKLSYCRKMLNLLNEYSRLTTKSSYHKYS